MNDANTHAVLRNALHRIRELQASVQELQRGTQEPIAIVGAACRFPGAESLEDFWPLLRDGVDVITPAPGTRWCEADGKRAYATAPDGPAGFLADVQRFDWQFFGLSQREAECMDPQQRLLLETCWEAVDDAGIRTDQLRGSSTGVFVGMYNSDYFHLQAAAGAPVGTYTASGNSHAMAANRISYHFDLHGPSVAVDTACSSGAMAVHAACQSLRHGESDMALVGAANLILSDVSNQLAGRALTLAADRRCKPFDARADGIVRAEGVAVLVLKRLSKAVEDRDRIHALVLGSAANHDGRTNGLTAPSAKAQTAVLRAALVNAGVESHEVGYIEAHGTGTTLGDPIEMEALHEVYGVAASPSKPCWLGSVKSNCGHMEAASGLAGIAKAVLAMKHCEIPPSLHFESWNPYIGDNARGFRVPVARAPWKATEPRRAAVSSFGFGGTNVHIVLGEAPAQPPAQPGRPPYLFLLSGHSEAALRARAGAVGKELLEGRDLSLADLCYTATARRTHFSHRLAAICSSRVQLATALAGFAEDGSVDGLVGAGSSSTVDLSSARVPIRLAEVAQKLGQRLPQLAELAARPGPGAVEDRLWGFFGLRPGTVHTGSQFRMSDAGDDEDARDPWKALLRAAGLLFLQGGNLSWHRFFDERCRLADLPRYPFQRQDCWLPELAIALPRETSVVQDKFDWAPRLDQTAATTQYLLKLVDELCEPELKGTISADVALADVGLDSLTVVDLRHRVESEFGVTIPLQVLMEGPDVATIARILLEQMDARGGPVARVDVPRKTVKMKSYAC